MAYFLARLMLARRGLARLFYFVVWEMREAHFPHNKI